MTINIDFDGTCVTHAFPYIGRNIGAEKVLKRLVKNGHQLILFTVRCDNAKEYSLAEDSLQMYNGKWLTEAVAWFQKNDIPLFGIQGHPDQSSWTTAPKSHADLMIDDTAVGCPLIYDSLLSDRPFVDWKSVEEILEKMGLFHL